MKWQDDFKAAEGEYNERLAQIKSTYDQVMNSPHPVDAVPCHWHDIGLLLEDNERLYGLLRQVTEERDDLAARIDVQEHMYKAKVRKLEAKCAETDSTNKMVFVLRVQPGDVGLVKLPGKVTVEQKDKAAQMWRDFFPNNKVMIIDDSADIGLIVTGYRRDIVDEIRPLFEKLLSAYEQADKALAAEYGPLSELAEVDKNVADYRRRWVEIVTGLNPLTTNSAV